MNTRSTVIDSPVGSLTLTASDKGLQEVLLPAGDTSANGQAAQSTTAQSTAAESAEHESAEQQPAGGADGNAAADQTPAEAILASAQQQLGEYFAGERRSFDLPLDLSGTEFQLRAWQALAGVGYGETASYGEQAERIGRAGAARAIGRANGANPVPIVLPCHRIVGADGSLTGYGGGLRVKEQLLAHEQAR